MLVPAMEGMKTVDAKLGVLLHPSRASDVQQGVHEILNSLLLRMNEEFDGVILAYLEPKILRHKAKILAGLNPYFHVDLTAKLLLFSPAPGMIIEGKVNKIEKDYIGVVVLGLFNAAIGVVDIREDLCFEAPHDGKRAWVSEVDNRHAIKLGSLIRFSVKSLQETENIIDICGSMMDESTGCVDWLKLISKSKEGKHKRKAKKEKHQDDSVRPMRYSQETVENPSPLVKEKGKGAMKDALVVASSKKRKQIEMGQSPQDSNHKFKRKKV